MSSRQNEWNAKHYDKIGLTIKKGSRERLKQIAKEQGYSLSDYIRHALIKAAKADGYGDISDLLGGGGGLTFESLRAYIERF